ncbi:hypothetical protein ACIBG8_47635 [Nonomuraea sp. NPDC050556]|uniref:hypothetical protein n=1 Tax=Nonomuraea sp. NPDC050556 TaxID=3364369 RepID=UPI0037AC8B7F
MAARRVTAVSAMLLSLALSGTAVAAAVPLLGASAWADPGVDPCDAGETCDPPEATVTVTTTLPTISPTEAVTTITVTPTPKKTKTPKPTPTKTDAPTPTQAPTITQNPQPISTAPSVPVSTPAPTTPEPEVALPTVNDTPTTQPTTDTTASETEPVQLEMHKAQDEFDQSTLTKQLSIPALILVLLALFAVLIFEGRLRRLAHAAAVRRAGPQQPEAAAPMPPGYPAGPGYATAAMAAPGYPGGTAYAPIISFVPIQTYPSGPVQYAPVYQQPEPVYETPQEPVVLEPDQFESSAEQPAYRDPFEPLVPPVPEEEHGLPHGAGAPYDPTVEAPLSPASAAELGDELPWQEEGPTVVHPLPQNPTLEAPRPTKRTIWRKNP